MYLRLWGRQEALADGSHPLRPPRRTDARAVPGPSPGRPRAVPGTLYALIDFSAVRGYLGHSPGIIPPDAFRIGSR